MTQTDPTLEFLDSLQDEERWEIVRQVPIFKPHTRTVKLPDGKSYNLTISANDLPRIVENMRRLANRHGVVQRVTLGHVKPELKEDEQPEIVGYATNPKIGRFGPGQELAILADLYIRSNKWDEAKKYPFRSAEYYPTEQTIRGVALLKRDPFLDLGMVAYQNSGGAIVSELLEGFVPETDDEEDDGLTPEEEQKAEAYLKHYMRKHPWVSYAVKCYEQANAGENGEGKPAIPSPTNTSLPEDDEERELPPIPEEEAIRMGKDSLMIALAKQNETIRRLERDAAEAKKRSETAECERIVTQLQALNYSLDRAAEVARLLPLSPAERQKHVAYVKAHYQRVPYGAFVPVDEAPHESGSAGFDERNFKKVVEYQRSHGCSFEQAQQAVAAGRV